MAKKAQTKGNLINDVTKRTALKKKDVTTVVDAVFDSIQDTLVAGDDVNIIGFGKFETRDRAERKGRNPQTGEEIMIPKTKTPGFKAGEPLKRAIKASI